MPNIEDLNLHPDFGDYEAGLNSRGWLEDAIVAKGAKVDGKGFGMGVADISFELEGHRFEVTIRPL